MFILAHLPLTPSWPNFLAIFLNHLPPGTPTSYLRKTLQHGAENMAPTHFLPPYIGVNLRRDNIKIAAYHRTYYCHIILSQTEHQPTFRLHLSLPSSGRRRRAWRVHIAKTTYNINREGGLEGPYIYNITNRKPLTTSIGRRRGAMEVPYIYNIKNGPKGPRYYFGGRDLCF